MIPHAPQFKADVFRLVHVPAQQFRDNPAHCRENPTSALLVLPSVDVLLTTVLQFPQCDGLLLRSKHAPEQHAGDTPVQGVALQEPQRVTLLLRLVQTPLQHED